MRRLDKGLVWLIFWTLAYLVLLNIFASSTEWQTVDYIYTSIFMLTLMIAVGINEGFLRSRFLRTGQYLAWIVLTDLNILALTSFNNYLFEGLIDFILPGYYFISYYTFIDLSMFFFSFVALATLVGFSIDWFHLKVVEKEKADAEFKALVNQINPHFLFNGLTVLYSLSLKDNKDTSSAIIKLSDILRYVIYQSGGKAVKLSSEASILRDYLDLQRYRVHPTTQIEFDHQLSSDVSVSPMLFLPLVENAFKHGVHHETANAFVRMTLREDNGVVNFTIANSNSHKTDSPGIGLKNLRERLRLLYPDCHTLVISETESVFHVNLKLSV